MKGTKAHSATRLLLAGVSGLLAQGCAQPWSVERDEARRSISAQAARETIGAHPDAGAPLGADDGPDTARVAERLGLSPDRLAELERSSGWGSYSSGPAPDPGPSLDGSATLAAPITLDDAVRLAIEHNLDVRAARLTPRIREQELALALSRFDIVFFTGVDWANLDEPTITPVVLGTPVGSPVNLQQSIGFETGLRKRLASTGGVLSASQGLVHSENRSPFIQTFPEPANNAFVDLSLRQPLLRGFGEDATLEEVRIAETLTEDGAEVLRAELLRVVGETERAYWSLARAGRAVRIAERLLERGEETKRTVRGRLGLDSRPAELADAAARVESRRATLLRARRTLRDASDRLKGLLNSPEFPVGDETLLEPTDEPTGEGVRFSVVDAATSAVRNRPDVRRAMLAIESAAVRQRAARNGLLPLLDLTLRTRLEGLRNDVGDAYADVGDGEFVSYLAGAQFEWPIGNSGPDAAYSARRLQRMQATLVYRSAVQKGVLEVKAALREAETNLELIAQTRAARLAAAESLRTLEAEERTVRALTPDFLDLKLRKQEALAQAELDEAGALTDYQASLARVYEATGEGLERRGISLDPAPADELADR